MAESKEELKSLLMKVKEESEKAGLKLNIQKSKIMASGPITSWQIDGETMETVTDFIFLGSKITEDGDCSHEIRRQVLLGRKAMTNLKSESEVAQSCLTLCDPMNCRPPDSSVHWQDYWSGLLCPSPEYMCVCVCVCVLNHFSCFRFFVTLWTVACQASLSIGILKARILGWVAMPSSKASSRPRDQTLVSCDSCIGKWTL